jgi:pimeloyl-ACP methyl ester carboxylesterase
MQDNQTSVRQFVTIPWQEETVRIEFQWIGTPDSDRQPDEAAGPAVVFLHEGLGSISQWKDFPTRFCDAVGLRGLVFSRAGYGQSSPRPAGQRWPTTFMHAQAHDMLPALFAALGIEKPWLFGHSDGASIALLHAARYPQDVSGLIVVAPHIFVEDVTIENIALARQAYLSTDLRAKLARHHADPDSAFWGWNDVWLDPDFRSWNIEDMLEAIACPILAVQGEQDEYGTLEQVRGIKRHVPQTELYIIAGCGHSPHRDQPEALAKEAARFLLDHLPDHS